MLCLFGFAALAQYNAGHAAAACAAQDTSRGTVTNTFSVATAGTYRVWSRILAPDTTNNSYILEIDGTTCGVVVGDNSSMPANAWTWVDYQSGTTTNKINVTLAAGSHTVTLIGRENNVEVDRVLLTADTACVPTGTGDNCVVTADTTAPSAPTNASASASSPTQVNLTWTAALDNIGVTGYTIYRNSTQLATVGAVTSYTDTTVKGSTAYSYTIKATDAAGNVSAVSNTANVTTPTPADTTAPAVPTGLKSSNTTTTATSVSWGASTDNVATTGYHVYRNGTSVGTVAASTTPTFSDSGLSSATAYSYTVDAYDAAGNKSSQSSALVVSTAQPADTTKPTAPTNVSLTANSSTSVTATWSPASDNVGVTGYYVLRGGVVIGQTTSTSYVDATASPSTSYTYAVEAFDAAKNVSSLSASASITTPAQGDTAAPTAPAGLSSSIASQAQVNLKWTASTDNIAVTAYKVTRNGTTLATVTTTSFGDSTVTAGTSYAYTVTALDAAGNPSAPVSINATVPSAWYGPVNGISATYFNNTTLSGLGTTRTDSNINFNWGSGSPMSGIGSDNFSVRWTGRVQAPATGNYTFYTESDDGVRLWINNTLVIDNWTLHSTRENSATVALTAGGRYNIKMEYYEKTGQAVAQLLWSGPSIASKSAVPTNELFTNSYSLLGTYFANANLTSPATYTQDDQQINFSWGAGAPSSQLPVDNFSTRWTGYVYVDTPGQYTFFTESDDGVRVTLNGKQVINNWTQHATTENSASLYLNNGIGYPIQIEYNELAGASTIQLLWSGPNISKQVVPGGNFRDR